MGCAVFAGRASAIDEDVISAPLQIETMSRAGLDGFDLQGTKRVVDAIMALS
jgi:hypothetical protein